MKPSIFVASAGSSLRVAHTLSELLEDHAEVTVWDQAFFAASEYTLSSIIENLANFDFGIFVFTDDDECISKGKQYLAPRDNVVFELGVFIGRLGKDSCLIVMPKKDGIKVPSDLSGLTLLTYDSERSDGNLTAALNSVASKTIRHIGKLGEISSERILSLETYLLKKHRKEYISDQFIKKLVCENQGALAQFNYLSSKRHKALKLAINKKKPNADQVIETITALDDYLQIEFKNACRFNFGYLIDDYFHKRYRKIKPRICLKTYDDENTVRSWYRDRRSPSNNSIYEVSANSGFEEVFSSGSYYLCNDIPSFAKAGKYINPRLQSDKTKMYTSSEVLEQKFLIEEKEDHRWIQCWKCIEVEGKEIHPKAEECYKSTLIIPLTLVNNDNLCCEFRQHFELDEDDTPERAIYGYLCFDSQYSNFFIEGTDVNIGYVFADILSLYLITYLNYTEFSDSYNKALDFLSQQSSE